MGASDAAGDAGVGMDCSMGSIVWVRRRNGSWWPGRILGPEELSASHLMSPRSGTPVKLLGREDASVDWYNLEKSKRVKAFRCGEFDACIERAEASQGALTKKREKYARREDAILHALELEKQLKSGASANSRCYKHSDGFKKELNSHSSSDLYLKDSELMALCKPVNPKPQSHTKIDSSSEEVNGTSRLNPQKYKNGKQMNWEDDNSDAVPRMRALQDFGLFIAPSRRKFVTSAACESSQGASVDDHVNVIPDGTDKIPFADKRKRSHGLMEEYPVKRRDRRRPLVQVLQNSTKLPAVQSLQVDCDSVSVLGQEEREHMGAICHVNRSRCMCSPADSSDCLDHNGCSSDQMRSLPTQVGCSNGLHQPGLLAGEDSPSGLIKDDETGSFQRDLVDADMEDGTTLLLEYKPLLPGIGNPERPVSQGGTACGDQEKLRKISNVEILSECKTIILSNDEAAGSTEMGVSKWHMKGKHNTRNVLKRSMVALDGKSSIINSDNCSGYLSGMVCGKNKKRDIFKMSQESMSRRSFYKAEYVYNDDSDDVSIEKVLKNRLIGFGKPNHPSMVKVASIESDDDSHEMFSSGWGADDPSRLSLRPYWVESDECPDPPLVHSLNVDMEPLLVDVNLKVQASYHGEHVPLVSLMSRLNGKAIIGHPVHIEILEESSTDLLFSKNVKGLDSTGVVEHAAPPHVCQTSRRTGMQRVPHPHLVPSASDDGESGLIPNSDGEHRHLYEKPYTAAYQASSVKKSSHQCQLTSGKSHKKLSKKGSLSSQKTKRLSSIAVEQKRNSMKTSAKHGRNGGSVLDGLIKPGGTVPLITCVPVKVVFSRLLEAVGRPISAGITRRSLLSGST